MKSIVAHRNAMVCTNSLRFNLPWGEKEIGEIAKRNKDNEKEDTAQGWSFQEEPLPGLCYQLCVLRQQPLPFSSIPMGAPCLWGTLSVEPILRYLGLGNQPQ